MGHFCPFMECSFSQTHHNQTFRVHQNLPKETIIWMLWDDSMHPSIFRPDTSFRLFCLIFLAIGQILHPSMEISNQGTEILGLLEILAIKNLFGRVSLSKSLWKVCLAKNLWQSLFGKVSLQSLFGKISLAKSFSQSLIGKSLWKSLFGKVSLEKFMWLSLFGKFSLAESLWQSFGKVSLAKSLWLQWDLSLFGRSLWGFWVTLHYGT